MPALPNTASALLRAIRSGDLSLCEAIDRQREGFAKGGQRWRCVTRRLEQDLLVDSSLPLAGVGLAHKDIFDLPGFDPGLGRGVGQPASRAGQAPVLTSLQRAGALNLGALTMAEDACSATAQTRDLPTPLNPRDPRLAVGGSSSGSGVAVAGGLAYASLGTDTAGSVRIPAMTCGVFGLKTTHNLVSRQGVAPLSSSLDSVGVLARSCEDIELVLRAIVKADGWSAAVQAPRLAHWLPADEMDESVAGLVSAVFQEFSHRSVDLGAHERAASALMQVVMAYETGQVHRQRIAAQLACPQVRAMGTLGLSLPPVWYESALIDRPKRLQGFLQACLQDADVLMVPLQTESLPDAQEVYAGGARFSVARLLAIHRFCGWVNYLGIPSLAVPIGSDSRGRSVSVQLLGRPREELTLLRVGRQLERAIHGEQGVAPSVFEEDWR